MGISGINSTHVSNSGWKTDFTLNSLPCTHNKANMASKTIRYICYSVTLPSLQCNIFKNYKQKINKYNSFKFSLPSALRTYKATTNKSSTAVHRCMSSQIKIKKSSLKPAPKNPSSRKHTGGKRQHKSFEVQIKSTCSDCLDGKTEGAAEGFLFLESL